MLTVIVLSAALTSFAPPQATPAPGLPPTTYRQRRERVMNALDGCITVVGSQGETSGITEDFRQDADFLWLTGINEPHAYLVLAPKARYYRSTLFLKPRDPEAERWTGPRDPISPDLLEKYGVDRVRRGSPEAALVALGAEHGCVAIVVPATLAREEREDAALAARLGARLGLKVVYRRDLLASLREAHDAEELARMERGGSDG